jgi:hypothetical protein
MNDDKDFPWLTAVVCVAAEAVCGIAAVAAWYCQ